MSQENVELVREAVDAYNRRDLDATLERWVPDAMLDWSNSHGPDAEVYRSRRQIRAFMHRFLEAWDEVRVELIGEPVEVEDGLLIAENVTHLRGRDGIEVQARSAWLITVRGGKQTSLKLYQTKHDALEAAGLAE
jgi:ketosteroid isomerase-like protein